MSPVQEQCGDLLAAEGRRLRAVHRGRAADRRRGPARASSSPSRWAVRTPRCCCAARSPSTTPRPAASSPARSSSSSPSTAPGTRWLTQLPHRRRRSTSSARSARPFPIPAGPSPAVLVGGGYGTAPLIPLARGAARQRLAGRDRHRRLDRRPAVRRARRQAAGRRGHRHHRRRQRGGAGPGHRRAARRDRAGRRRGRLRLRADGDAARGAARSPATHAIRPRSRSRRRWPAASGCA